MEDNKIRRALKAHIDRRHISVNDWCRRAGIPARTVYAFLEGKTKDLGSSRLVALADAEQMSVDQLIGRTSFDRTKLLATISPLVMRLGSKVSLEDIARETGVPIPSLQLEWISISDLIVDVYLQVMPEQKRANISKAEGEKAADRLTEIARTSLRWIADHPDFYLAFQSAIIAASSSRREQFTKENLKVVNHIKKIALDNARDLLITDDIEKTTLAHVFLTMFRSASITYAHNRNLDETLRQFKETVSLVLGSRVAK